MRYAPCPNCGLTVCDCGTAVPALARRPARYGERDLAHLARTFARAEWQARAHRCRLAKESS